jgi:hypothetical protein
MRCHERLKSAMVLFDLFHFISFIFVIDGCRWCYSIYFISFHFCYIFRFDSSQSHWQGKVNFDLTSAFAGGTSLVGDLIASKKKKRAKIAPMGKITITVEFQYAIAA